MPSAGDVEREINSVIGQLVEKGFADDQRCAFRRNESGGRVHVTFDSAEHLSIVLRDRSYGEVFGQLVGARAYNVKMLDGALIQMLYVFAGGRLERHRLAFFSSPTLEEYQNNQEVYDEDEIYADVVGREVVPFPLRFDYDARVEKQEVYHPACHLTLGQYTNCRIPVSSPLTPLWFMDFVLRNFYFSAASRSGVLSGRKVGFSECIELQDRKVVHVRVPNDPWGNGLN